MGVVSSHIRDARASTERWLPGADRYKPDDSNSVSLTFLVNAEMECVSNAVVLEDDAEDACIRHTRYSHLVKVAGCGLSEVAPECWHVLASWQFD